MLNRCGDNAIATLLSSLGRAKYSGVVTLCSATREINFIKMISKKPFMLVHEDTNQILGPFKEFELDKAFKVIDTDKGEIELSDEELDDILKGKYDFTF